MPDETPDPTGSAGMWDNRERSPLETAAFEQWETIFEQKIPFESVSILWMNQFSYFSLFICKRFELLFSKARLVAYRTPVFSKSERF